MMKLMSKVFVLMFLTTIASATPFTYIKKDYDLKNGTATYVINSDMEIYSSTNAATPYATFTSNPTSKLTVAGHIDNAGYGLSTSSITFADGTMLTSTSSLNGNFLLLAQNTWGEYQTFQKGIISLNAKISNLVLTGDTSTSGLIPGDYDWGFSRLNLSNGSYLCMHNKKHEYGVKLSSAGALEIGGYFTTAPDGRLQNPNTKLVVLGNMNNIGYGLTTSSITFADGTVQTTASGEYPDTIAFSSITITGMLDVNEGTVTTLDGNEVRYATRMYTRPVLTSSETAACYIKIDPTNGTNDQKIGWYGEITDAQDDTEAAFFKIIHDGHGDATYVAMFGTAAVAFEAASFTNGTKGIISTNQIATGESAFYTTCFSGLWGNAEAPGYGIFYADQSSGYSYRSRAMAGVAANTPMIAVSDENLVNTVELRQGGEVWCSSVALTGQIKFSDGVNIGLNSTGNTIYGVGVGHNAYDNNYHGVGIGDGAYGNSNSGIGIGYYASDNHNLGIGIGFNAYDNDIGGIGIGQNSMGNTQYGIGIGAFTNAVSSGVAIGCGSSSSDSGFAIGAGAKNTASGGGAIGSYAINHSTNTITTNKNISNIGYGVATSSITFADGTVITSSSTLGGTATSIAASAITAGTMDADVIAQTLADNVNYNIPGSSMTLSQLTLEGSSGNTTVSGASVLISTVAQVTFEGGVKISSMSVVLNKGFALVNATNYHDVPFWFNDSGKNYVITKVQVVVSTTSGNTATLSGKLQKVNADGVSALADISWNNYSITSGVATSSDTFSSSTIEPNKWLKWNTDTSTNMNNDISSIAVWLREE